MSAYPFGDPCRRCGASSAAAHPGDRECGCVACPTCGTPTGDLCGYCGGSLGCKLHKVTIDLHVKVTCSNPPKEIVEVKAGVHGLIIDGKLHV